MKPPLPTKPQKIIIYLLSSLGLLLCISFALYLLSNQQQTENLTTTNISSTAINIIDGDTFETASGETIRLLCVDTPELGSEGSQEAKEYLSELILLGENITIERAGKDKYNRTLAWVYADDIFVNKNIVGEGMGGVFEYDETNCSKIY